MAEGRRKKKATTIYGRSRLKCFHNGIILIVNCFKNLYCKDSVKYLNKKLF